MPEKIKIKPEVIDAQLTTTKTKHFEDVWEASEALFNAKDLSVENILNELQAKASLYRMLGKGSFDSNELAKTKTLLIGKLIMTLTMLTLAENANAFEALGLAIEDKKLLNLETSVNRNAKNGFDGILNDLSSKIGASPEMSQELVAKMKDMLEKMTSKTG